MEDVKTIDKLDQVCVYTPVPRTNRTSIPFKLTINQN